jgi:hypothetical protein
MAESRTKYKAKLTVRSKGGKKTSCSPANTLLEDNPKRKMSKTRANIKLKNFGIPTFLLN